VQAVHVCTGPATHAALAATALSAGKHVLVEKPLAASADDVRRLAHLAEGSHLRLAAVHQMPFQDGFVDVRRSLSRLGALVRIAYTAATAGGVGRSASERRALLIEILPHPVSLFRALLGGSAPNLDLLSFTDDDLELAGDHAGARLAVSVSLRARPTRHELLVSGTGGTALVDLFHGFGTVDRAAVSRVSKALGPFRSSARLMAAAAANLARRALRQEPAYPGLRPLIEAFYGSVRGEASPPVSTEEMVEAALLMERVGNAPGPVGPRVV
jgi:predicted dehydrogenase